MVIFCKKVRLFQRGVTYSSKTLFPFFAALGRMRLAGTLNNSLLQENHVLPSIPTRDTTSVIIASGTLNKYFNGEAEDRGQDEGEQRTL